MLVKYEKQIQFFQQANVWEIDKNQFNYFTKEAMYV
jgi:hypothetical protein